MGLIEDLAARAASLTGIGVGKRGWGSLFTRNLMTLSIGAGIIPSGREIVNLAHMVGGTVGRNTVNQTRNSYLGMARGERFDPKTPLAHIPQPEIRLATSDGYTPTWYGDPGTRNYIIRVTPVDIVGNRGEPTFRSLTSDVPLSWEQVLDEAKGLWDAGYFGKDGFDLEFAPERVLITKGPDESIDGDFA